MISEQERIKIPKYISKDILDVERFQADEIKSTKFVMIIAFLSTDIVILNRNTRLDETKKMINIIGNGLRKMKELKIPIILKVIYIQIIKKPKKSIEKLLEEFKYDKNIFDIIKFKYIYLPNIYEKPGGKNDLMKYPEYKNNFENIIKLLNKTKEYNSVSSLLDYVDDFNEAINGKIFYHSKKFDKDIESDFNGVYNQYEKRLKNELIGKINSLKKLDNLNETFDNFIKSKDNSDFTFYGGIQVIINIYENSKKEKLLK